MNDLLEPVLIKNSCADVCPVGRNCLKGFIDELQLCKDEVNKVVTEVSKIDGVEFKSKSFGRDGYITWVRYENDLQFTPIIFSNGERIRG